MASLWALSPLRRIPQSAVSGLHLRNYPSVCSFSPKSGTGIWGGEREEEASLPATSAIRSSTSSRLLNVVTAGCDNIQELITHVRPIEGLVSAQDIQLAKRDWNGACDTVIAYARNRTFRELRRITQRHRDPFLAADASLARSGSPLAEYRKITTEILQSLPGQKKFPLRRAEAMRSYLMFRLGMHLGLRQRNLRGTAVLPAREQSEK